MSGYLHQATRECLFHSLYYLNAFWREGDLLNNIYGVGVFDSYFHGCFKDLIPSMVD